MRPSARIFLNSAKLWPGKTPAKRRPQKIPWRECHHVLIKIFLKFQPSTTFCCKWRLPKSPWSRAMANLPRRPSARVFLNSAKLWPGETPAKRRPQKTPRRECQQVLITISLKCQATTTLCCHPRLPKCPWSRAMANLPRRPSKILQSCDQGKLLQKEGHKNHTLARMSSCPNYHFLKVPT